MRSRLQAAFVLAALTCSAPPADPEHDDVVESTPKPKSGPGAEIDVATLRSLTAELSSDAYEGRGTGTPGGQRAAKTVASEMEARGFETTANGFALPLTLQGSTAGGVSLRWSQGKHSADVTGFVAQSESPAGPHDWSRALVFVGYGIDNGPQWNDYAGVDVTDKIVVALVGEPDAEPFRARPPSSVGRWTSKLDWARAHGAAGCLVVHTPDAGYDWAVVQTSFSGERFSQLPAPSPPMALRGWLSATSFESLVGLPISRAQRRASEAGGATRVLSRKLEASYEQRIRLVEEVNLVSRIGSGSAPVVIVTAHWDHLGRVPFPVPAQDPIFNGAVDNASGVASLLALGSALARRHRETPLAGTVYLVATAAEEHDLLGSRAFARDLPVPLESVAAAINLDGMNVGDATPTVELVSAGYSTLDALFDSALVRQGRRAVPDRSPQSGAAYRSDHLPFLQLGIPILYPSPGFSGSVDLIRAGQKRTARYHAVSDDFDPAWSFEGALADTQAIYDVVIDIADGKVRPRMLTDPPSPTTR
ncbi:MAG: M28 family peptidase [Nannocystales bacterium]